MAQHKEAGEARSADPAPQKTGPELTGDHAAEEVLLDRLADSLVGSGEGPPGEVESGRQVDPRFQTAQRQQIFARMARVGGNLSAGRLVPPSRRGGGEQIQTTPRPPARQGSTAGPTDHAPVVQRSPLSDELARLWNPSRKGAFFDRLRSLSAEERADPDLSRFVETSDRLGGDDRWLAQRILQHGPEPLWPAADLQERQRRAAEHRWDPEAGGIAATLSAENEGVRAESTAYFFPGISTERALIIGGMHGSELSAVQVAERLVDDLRAGRGPRPYFTVIIVPRLFAANVARAESEAAARPGSVNSPANIGRYSSDRPRSTDPNRQFPTAGRAFDPTRPVDARGRPIEPANIILLELIQRFQPSRVANLHSIRSAADAGIYADPRTDVRGRACGFGPDRDLALAMAGEAGGSARVGGSTRSSSGDVNAVYPRDPAAVPAGRQQPRSPGGSRAYQQGTSFGTWASTEVSDPSRPEFNRPAMTVITVEVATAFRPEDLPAAKQAARRAELGAHSAALQEIFLGEPGTGGRPAAATTCAPPTGTAPATGGGSPPAAPERSPE